MSGELTEGEVSQPAPSVQPTKDELIIAALQTVRKVASERERPWSRKIIFTVVGDLITTWLLAPDGQKFALDTFNYLDVNPERTLELCDEVWEGVDKTVPEPQPIVTDEDIVRQEHQAYELVHQFPEVEYTFPEDVSIGYNGQMFHAKGDVKVKVPQCILQTWLDAEKERMAALAAMAVALRARNLTAVN